MVRLPRLLVRRLAGAAHLSPWYTATQWAPLQVMQRREISSHGGKEGERSVSDAARSPKPVGTASLVMGPQTRTAASPPRKAPTSPGRGRNRPRGLARGGGGRRNGSSKEPRRDEEMVRGSGQGVGIVPAHLNNLWAWARERAHLNAKIKSDWLSQKYNSLREGHTHRAPRRRHGVERSRAPAQGDVETAQSVPADVDLTPTPTPTPTPRKLEWHRDKDVNGGKTLLLTREFWDHLLLQRDPTKGLRDVALRSLMHKETEDGKESTPLDPTLWWMEDMVRIKWGGGGYLPESLRQGGERKPVLGEKVLINHVIQVVAQAPCRLRLRWAALLHDVGKPKTAEMDAGKLSFPAHERVGALMVHDILAPYGYDDKFCKEVATLVLRSGRVRMVEKFNDQGVRRLMSNLGPLFDDLLDLYSADCTSARAHKQAQHQARADLLARHMQAVLDRDRLASLRSPLNGHDIMRLTGLRPGMKLGLLIRALRDDYLTRGPYSASQAHQVVERLHEELASGKFSSPDKPGFNSTGLFGQPRFKRRIKRADMELNDLSEAKHHGESQMLAAMRTRPAGKMTGGTNDTSWKPLREGSNQKQERESSDEVRVDQVLVLRLRIDRQRSQMHRAPAAVQDAGDAAAVRPDAIEADEVFRDVAVRRDTSLYTLAKVVTHAFDFDFDDDFAFYRRRRGLECPGAEAAHSGIPATARRSSTACVELASGRSAAGGCLQQMQQTSRSAPMERRLQRAQHADAPHEDAASEEAALEQDFELLVRATGEPLRCLNSGGFAFRYDRVEDLGAPGKLSSDSVAEWQPHREDDEHIPASSLRKDTSHEDMAAASPFHDTQAPGSRPLCGGGSTAGVEFLSYPLRLPQHGPANLFNTLVGNLFDRSRRSLVFALYHSRGGPWFIRIDFVEARDRKHYETSLPCVTARLGRAPRP